jgi:hypothetical protein
MKNNSKKEIVKSALDKIKLVDAGVKDKYGLMQPVKSPSLENRITYPHLSLNTKEAPILAGSEVGDKITMIIQANVISHSLRENPQNKCEDFSLEIEKIGVVSSENNKKEEKE